MLSESRTMLSAAKSSVLFGSTAELALLLILWYQLLPVKIVEAGTKCGAFENEALIWGVESLFSHHF